MREKYFLDRIGTVNSEITTCFYFDNKNIATRKTFWYNGRNNDLYLPKIIDTFATSTEKH